VGNGETGHAEFGVPLTNFVFEANASCSQPAQAKSPFRSHQQTRERPFDALLPKNSQ
jgi:hypothetical protein